MRASEWGSISHYNIIRMYIRNMYLRTYLRMYVCTYRFLSHSGMLIMLENVAGFLPANSVAFAAKA